MILQCRKKAAAKQELKVVNTTVSSAWQVNQRVAGGKERKVFYNICTGSSSLVSQSPLQDKDILTETDRSALISSCFTKRFNLDVVGFFYVKKKSF